MNALDLITFALMALGIVLAIVAPLAAARWRVEAADGLIVGTAVSELLALALGLWAGQWTIGSLGAAVVLLWMTLVYLLFVVLAALDRLPDDTFPDSHCVPKKTFGQEVDYRDQQFVGIFTKLAVRFRCRASDTNLHKSLRGRRYRYWVFLLTRTTVICRHDSTILCDGSCNAGVNHVGEVQKGGADLRVHVFFTQLVFASYVQLQVKMFAALGAARVVLTIGGTAGGTSGQSAGGTVAVAPGTSVTGGSTHGSSVSLNAGLTVTFPDASKVIEYDAGMFQWQCTPPDKDGVFRLDLAKLAQQRPAASTDSEQ